ncbi:MAG: WD40 repeat domain-containing protein [Legionellaceae bacterium]|nr:WD40 repeat domain-containing protein [Legionellaceae bacterium]
MPVSDKLIPSESIQKYTATKRKRFDSGDYKLDRFIPLRASNDLTHNLTTPKPKTHSEVVPTPYEKALKAALSPQSNTRVLLFSPPKEVKPHHPIFETPHHSIKKAVRPAQRQFMSTTILDAPNFVDDFYSNTLACTKNHIFIAITSNSYNYAEPRLYSEIYTSNAMNSSADQTVTTSEVKAVGTMINAILPANETSVLSGWSNGILRLHNIESGVYFQKINTGLPVNLYSLSQISATTFACGNKTGTLKVIDTRLALGSIRFQTNAHTQSIPGIAFDSNYHLATGSNDNTVKLWDIRKPDTGPIICHDIQKAGIKALAFYEGTTLISGSGTADQTICTINTQSGKVYDRVNTHAQVTGIQCLQDPRYFVSSHGYSEGGLKLWRINKDKKLRLVSQTPTGSPHRLLSLVASPVEDTLVTLKTDETLRFFKVLNPHAKESSSLTNSPKMLESIPCLIR